mmetsp:Transcript_119923/g.344601  ORF Transcript_119923/g.344601 Transcript_119923/m.344601 type:complete len:360 (-) Transcript_119923:227-1306(-)
MDISAWLTHSPRQVLAACAWVPRKVHLASGHAGAQRRVQIHVRGPHLRSLRRLHHRPHLVGRCHGLDIQRVVPGFFVVVLDDRRRPSAMSLAVILHRRANRKPRNLFIGFVRKPRLVLSRFMRLHRRQPLRAFFEGCRAHHVKSGTRQRDGDVPRVHFEVGLRAPEDLRHDFVVPRRRLLVPRNAEHLKAHSALQVQPTAAERALGLHGLVPEPQEVQLVDRANEIRDLSEVSANSGQGVVLEGDFVLAPGIQGCATQHAELAADAMVQLDPHALRQLLTHLGLAQDDAVGLGPRLPRCAGHVRANEDNQTAFPQLRVWRRRRLFFGVAILHGDHCPVMLGETEPLGHCHLAREAPLRP